jgi:radical SAM protein with 4Fe4S-binding SPASM domain
MLAVDHKGELNLCHRFTGSSLPTFGNVHSGVKQVELNDFLSQRLDRTNTGCEDCRSATCAPAAATTKATPATATRPIRPITTAN